MFACAQASIEAIVAQLADVDVVEGAEHGEGVRVQR
jgi:hypothetical protein